MTRRPSPSAFDFERLIFGRGADERDHALFDKGKKRILLSLVEAMHFVDKQDGVSPRLRERRFCPRNRVAYILDAGKHRR